VYDGVRKKPTYWSIYWEMARTVVIMLFYALICFASGGVIGWYGPQHPILAGGAILAIVAAAIAVAAARVYREW